METEQQLSVNVDHAVNNTTVSSEINISHVNDLETMTSNLVIEGNFSNSTLNFK